VTLQGHSIFQNQILYVKMAQDRAIITIEHK